jgi:hypothetical protein
MTTTYLLLIGFVALPVCCIYLLHLLDAAERSTFCLTRHLKRSALLDERCLMHAELPTVIEATEK